MQAARRSAPQIVRGVGRGGPGDLSQERTWRPPTPPGWAASSTPSPPSTALPPSHLPWLRPGAGGLRARQRQEGGHPRGGVGTAVPALLRALPPRRCSAGHRGDDFLRWVACFSGSKVPPPQGSLSPTALLPLLLGYLRGWQLPLSILWTEHKYARASVFSQTNSSPWPPHLASKPTHLVLWKRTPRFCPIAMFPLSTITVLARWRPHRLWGTLPARRGVQPWRSELWAREKGPRQQAQPKGITLLTPASQRARKGRRPPPAALPLGLKATGASARLLYSWGATIFTPLIVRSQSSRFCPIISPLH